MNPLVLDPTVRAPESGYSDCSSAAVNLVRGRHASDRAGMRGRQARGRGKAAAKATLRREPDGSDPHYLIASDRGARRGRYLENTTLPM